MRSTEPVPLEIISSVEYATSEFAKELLIGSNHTDTEPAPELPATVRLSPCVNARPSGAIPIPPMFRLTEMVWYGYESTVTTSSLPSPSISAASKDALLYGADAVVEANAPPPRFRKYPDPPTARSVRPSPSKSLATAY